MKALQQLASFAKASATHGGQSVVLCGSHDLKHCDGDWSTGWLVMVKDTQMLLRQHAVTVKGFQLRWRGGLSQPQLVFQPSGTVLGAPGSFWGVYLK